MVYIVIDSDHDVIGTADTYRGVVKIIQDFLADYCNKWYGVYKLVEQSNAGGSDETD
jgi:hypothetical protein